jgi:hypothetical protein
VYGAGDYGFVPLVFFCIAKLPVGVERNLLRVKAKVKSKKTK